MSERESVIRSNVAGQLVSKYGEPLLTFDVFWGRFGDGFLSGLKKVIAARCGELVTVWMSGLFGFWLRFGSVKALLPRDWRQARFKLGGRRQPKRRPNSAQGAYLLHGGDQF